MSDEPRPLLEPQNVEAARRATAAHALCDHCLGRLFGRVETGFTNPERARILREALGTEATAPEACFVCEGLFGELDEFADLVLEALEPYQFDTYLVGSRLDDDVQAREKEARAEAGVDETTENANVEVNREVGKRVHEATGREVDFNRPDITAVVDTRFNVVDLTFGSLYLYGRYRKFSRDIPQTRWPCRLCSGRGCFRCEGGGKQYETSVQELVQSPAMELTGATDAIFHGAGREDVDARCVGTGRPFVLELKDPRRRRLDLRNLEFQINEHARPIAEIEGLRPAEKDEVQRVKETRGSKTYRAHVAFETAVDRENLFKAIESLRGAAVAQRTPSRVDHRRVDKVRKRRVLGIEVESAEGALAVLRVKGDAGLYIKELVSGDEGRTRPSLAELLDIPAHVTALDIIEVEYEDPVDANAAT